METQNIYTIYSEHTPNPNVLKFVSNIALFNSTKEFFDKPNKIDFPLINLLFNFPFVVKVFLGKNFISIEKGNKLDWIEFSSEIRSFIQQKLNEGIKASTITISNDTLQKKIEKKSTIEQKIEHIIDKEIRPYIQMDGGEIKLISFENGIVKVSLQGACRGCPSSVSTLKNGIENKLKSEIPDKILEVISV